MLRLDIFRDIDNMCVISVDMRVDDVLMRRCVDNLAGLSIIIL